MITRCMWFWDIYCTYISWQEKLYITPSAIRLDTILNSLLLYILITNLCMFYLLFTSFCMLLSTSLYIDEYIYIYIYIEYIYIYIYMFVFCICICMCDVCIYVCLCECVSLCNNKYLCLYIYQGFPIGT